jgi:hypothetical protein
MDNTPVNPSQHDEEEYQFTEEESTPKYQPPVGGSASTIEESNNNRKAFNKKRLIIIIGIIVGAFCLYKLYGLFMAEPPKAPPQVKPAVPVSPAPAPAVINESVIDKENLKQKVSTLEEAIVQNGKSQENLQNEIGGVTSAITEIQSNIAVLTQQINTLVKQKNEASTKPVITKEKEKPKKVVQKTVYRPKKKLTYSVYYIKALIQGRVWLVNNNGATFTVSTGDELPGYGQIQEIIPDKGRVMTSSGRVITFMSSDR